MVKGVECLLFSINLISDGQLYLAEHYIFVANVDQYVSGPKLQSIFYADNFEIILLIADSLEFLVDSENLVLMRTKLASQ